MHSVSHKGQRLIAMIDDEAPYIYWTVPETCIALICACLPTLRPLFARWTPNLLRSRITGSTSRTAHTGSKNSRGWSATASGDKFLGISANKSHGGAASESVQNLNDPLASEGIARDERDVELADLPQARTRPDQNLSSDTQDGMYR